MDEISALNQSSGQSIQAILLPTFKIFLSPPPQKQNRYPIHPRRNHLLRSSPRQKLDIYRALNENSSTPILVFFHGGGLIRGDKNTPQIPENVVYHNVGAFFASRGITTINPNYRRVNSEIGGEDAVFLLEGRMWVLVLKCLEELEPKGREMFIYLEIRRVGCM